MTSKILQSLILGLAISTVLALNCYKCTSSDNHLCASKNIINSSLPIPSVKCSEGSLINVLIPYQCIKIITLDKDDNEDVTRSCAPNLNTTCATVTRVLLKTTTMPELKDIICATCTDDNCNL